MGVNLLLKKRLLYIVESFGGGVFSYLVDLSNGLSDQYDICIAYSIRKQTPDNFKDYFNPQVKLVRISNFTRGVNPVKDIKAMFEIKKVRSIFKPDIIHFHSSKAGVLGRTIFAFSGLKLFYTPHGYSFLMRDESRYKRLFYWCIEKIMGRVTCTTISCSKGEFDESLGLTKNNELINNGVNVRKLEKMEKEFTTGSSDKITIFTIGRISEQKNPATFNQVARQFPDIQFIWVGDGELRSTLDAKNIKVTGWVDRKQVIEISNHSDIFLLTSLWEGLPISLLEAMYLRKACLVSNVIGNKDVIDDGENGFICNNVNEFKEKLDLVISNADLRHQMANKAKNDVLTKYSVDDMVKNYDKVYSK